MLRPCGGLQDQDGMQMVRHEDHGIYLHVGGMPGELMPCRLDDFAGRAELHTTVVDLAQQSGASVGADGDKVGSRCAVVES